MLCFVFIILPATTDQTDRARFKVAKRGGRQNQTWQQGKCLAVSRLSWVMALSFVWPKQLPMGLLIMIVPKDVCLRDENGGGGAGGPTYLPGTCLIVDKMPSCHAMSPMSCSVPPLIRPYTCGQVRVSMEMRSELWIKSARI